MNSLFSKPKWSKTTFMAGLGLFFIGTIDPLEGSVVLCGGSLLLAIASHFSTDRHRKLFLIYFILMVVGVFFLFYFSSLGGFGEGYLSWWWGIFVLPYPIAWLATIITLIYRAARKPQDIIH